MSNSNSFSKKEDPMTQIAEALTTMARTAALEYDLTVMCESRAIVDHVLVKLKTDLRDLTPKTYELSAYAEHHFADTLPVIQHKVLEMLLRELDALIDASFEAQKSQLETFKQQVSGRRDALLEAEDMANNPYVKVGARYPR